MNKNNTLHKILKEEVNKVKKPEVNIKQILFQALSEVFDITPIDDEMDCFVDCLYKQGLEIVPKKVFRHENKPD